LLEQLQAAGFLQLPELRKRGGLGPRRADLCEPVANRRPSNAPPVNASLWNWHWWKVKPRAAGGASRSKNIITWDAACRSGAHLRYWVRTHRELACLLWASPAWKMQVRDEWIGWSDEQRQDNLQRIVSNGRFLTLPWVGVKGLASKILALAARQLPHDWESHYGHCPLLLETLVDASRFRGTCYRAAKLPGRQPTKDHDVGCRRVHPPVSSPHTAGGIPAYSLLRSSWQSPPTTKRCPVSAAIGCGVPPIHYPERLSRPLRSVDRLLFATVPRL
jgi:hypothetical protein